MRQLLFLGCAILLNVTALADETKTCKVKGTDGTVEMSVNLIDEKSGKCLLSFSNDTDKNVNVRYVVTNGSKTIPGSILVYANGQSTKEVSFGKEIKSTDVRLTTFTGEKCQ